MNDLPNESAPSLVAWRHAQDTLSSRLTAISHLRKKWWMRASSVILGFVMLGGIVAFSPTVRHQFAISLTRQDDGYTELYFTQPSPVSLPDSIAGSQIAVDFSVANHERRFVQYTYLAQAYDSNDALLGERTGYVNTLDAEVPNFRVVLTIPKGRPWAVVNVSLIGRRETIHYIAPKARTLG